MDRLFVQLVAGCLAAAIPLYACYSKHFTGSLGAGFAERGSSSREELS